MSTIANKYFVKDSVNTTYTDITTKFVGLTLLKVDSFSKQGKAKNIFTQSWINSANEDVYIPDTVYFEQPDVDITFCVKDFDNHNIDVQAVHDSFISYMTTNKVTIKSLYEMKSADLVCLAEYKPTLTHLKRVKGQNYIIGTLTMHKVTNSMAVTS